MSYASDHPVTCADTNCAAKHPGGKWGNIRAARGGWFECRDGTSYCPKHVPKWVRKLREK